MTLFNTIIGLICLLVGAVVQGFYTEWKTRQKKKTSDEIAENRNIECEECDMEHLKDEWKTTIDTQMHFNDLIIKFRSVVLSVFLTGLGVVFGLSKKMGSNDNLYFILTIAFVFWICCFLLDYFYYQKLLLGAVKHAEKFDENEFFQKKGLFGLTKSISFEISGLLSKSLIWIFYILPLVVLGILVHNKLV